MYLRMNEMSGVAREINPMGTQWIYVKKVSGKNLEIKTFYSLIGLFSRDVFVYIRTFSLNFFSKNFFGGYRTQYPFASLKKFN